MAVAPAALCTSPTARLRAITERIRLARLSRLLDAPAPAAPAHTSTRITARIAVPDSLCGTTPPVTGTGHPPLRFRDQPSPSRDSPPTPGRVASPQLPHQPRDLALCDLRGCSGGMTIMNVTQTGPHNGPSGDPRVGWSATDADGHAPALHHRRDGILPTIAAALSVRGATLTCTAARGGTPPRCTRSSRTSSTP
ncbi:hypothetical protein SHKM778_86080 [Streptomyces sp. KM77-8]|uniref:Uncharacterized protein n=1 Tax=Streptomyces haneummycinicus TaxID=3074435 RepID=A0AAT9HXN6_9ACTN